MNIFVTDKCYKLCAQSLDDKRVIKMILETAQLLSTAVYINSGNKYEDLYKPTHIKHPCTIWAAKTRGNWIWLYNYLKALCKEYNFRYGRVHAIEKKLLLEQYKSFIPEGSILNFVNCTRSEAIDFRDKIYQAYRNYLMEIRYSPSNLEK